MVAAHVGRRKLSELTDISYGQLGRKLQGRIPFDIVELFVIAKALQLPPSDLLPVEFSQAASA